MEEVNEGESWNKKRIFIAVLLLLLLIAGGYFFKTRILGTEIFPLQEQKLVKGVSVENEGSEEDFTANIKDSVRERINNLKQEASNLDILEIASSSPQVQKILNDIKSLEQYPTNQVKEICRKICGL